MMLLQKQSCYVCEMIGVEHGSPDAVLSLQFDSFSVRVAIEDSN